MSSSYLVSRDGVFYTFSMKVLFPDPGTFRQVGDKGPVGVDERNAYWGISRFDADPASLACLLPGCLYKDRNAAYAYGARLTRTDVASFRLLAQPHLCLALAADREQRFIIESLTGGFMSQPDSLGANPSKLKKVLSITRVPIEGDEDAWIDTVTKSYVPASPPDDGGEETFMIVRDGVCLFETRRRVPADPASFAPLSEQAGRDKSHFFWGAAIVPEVDRNTVEFIDDCFYKDAQHVFGLFHFYSPIPKADPHSFRFIEPPSMGARYAVDAASGYCVMHGAQRLKTKRFRLPDPGALRVLRPAFATDGITVFEDGVPLEPDETEQVAS